MYDYITDRLEKPRPALFVECLYVLVSFLFFLFGKFIEKLYINLYGVSAHDTIRMVYTVYVIHYKRLSFSPQFVFTRFKTFFHHK